MNNLTFREDDHSYFLDGVRIPSVTQVLKGAGLIDYSGLLNMPDGYKRLQAAQRFGTAVHKACELYDLDNLDEQSLDPALRPYLDGWIKFLDESDFVIENIEMMVCSVKYRFAGKLDRSGLLYDKRTILDIKSSFEIMPANHIQNGGYTIAYNEGKQVKDKVYQRAVVQLRGDGTYKIELSKDPNDLNIFLSALTIHNFKEAHQ